MEKTIDLRRREFKKFRGSGLTREQVKAELILEEMDDKRFGQYGRGLCDICNRHHAAKDHCSEITYDR